MTEDELRAILSPQSEPTFIMGDKMRDVAFWPLSIKTTDTHYELSGIWYSNVFEDIMGHSNGQPLRETIKIKKEDLVNWKKREKKSS